MSFVQSRVEGGGVFGLNVVFGLNQFHCNFIWVEIPKGTVHDNQQHPKNPISLYSKP